MSSLIEPASRKRPLPNLAAATVATQHGAPRCSGAPSPMSPGDYLRLRREAAGLDRDEVALLLAYDPHAPHLLACHLQQLEENRAAFSPAFHMLLVDRLQHVFPFSPAVYYALIGFAADPAAGLPAPAICTGCGCTWTDPCGGREGVPFCAWRPATAGAPDRCTACPPVLRVAS